MAKGWKRLAHEKLSSAAVTIDSGTFAVADLLRIVVYTSGTNTETQIRFNSDTGNNYSSVRENDGGSESNFTSQSMSKNNATGDGLGTVMTATIYNRADKEKQAFCQQVASDADGAANAPRRAQGSLKWANTSDRITSIQVVNNYGSGNTFAAGSYITVFAATDDTVTDEKTLLTNVAAGTRYEETDTRKIYRRKGAKSSSDADHSFDFSSNSGWTLDTHHTISSGTLNFDSDSSLDGVRATYDLGTALGDTWVLRWKWSFTTLNLPNDSNYKWHFGISNTASKNSSSHDWIAADMDLRNSSGYQERKMEAKVSDDQTHQSGDYEDTYSMKYHFTNTWSGTDYYCELIRDGTTTGSFTYNIYSDSNYSNLLNSAKNSTSTKNPTGLKYIWSGIDDYSGAGRSPLEWAGKIDNIEIYNNTNTLDAQWKERGES